MVAAGGRAGASTFAAPGLVQRIRLRLQQPGRGLPDLVIVGNVITRNNPEAEPMRSKTYGELLTSSSSRCRGEACP